MFLENKKHKLPELELFSKFVKNLTQDKMEE